MPARRAPYSSLVWFFFFLEVPTGLDPQPGLLEGSRVLRSMRARQALGQIDPGPME